jgi:hypothetical protein
MCRLAVFCVPLWAFLLSISLANFGHDSRGSGSANIKELEYSFAHGNLVHIKELFEKARLEKRKATKRARQPRRLKEKERQLKEKELQLKELAIEIQQQAEEK